MKTPMQKIIFLFSALFFTLLSSKAFSQFETQRVDNDLYVFFEEKMQGIHEVSTYKLNLGNNTIYVFEVWEPRKRTFYHAVDSCEYKIIDEKNFLELDVKPSHLLIDIKNFDPDKDLIRSKKYDRVFVLEKVGEQRYKMVEIVNYIDDVFLAPERRSSYN